MLVLLTCQAMYGIERGDRIIAVLEEATGEPCPCKQGVVCPLMPADSVELEPVTHPLHGFEQRRPTSGAVAQGRGDGRMA